MADPDTDRKASSADECMEVEIMLDDAMSGDQPGADAAPGPIAPCASRRLEYYECSDEFGAFDSSADPSINPQTSSIASSTDNV